MYYNTTDAPAEVVVKRKQHNLKQDDRILEIFKRAQKPLTPFDVFHQHKVQYHFEIPITSVRRAITNLTQSGKLIKSNTKKEGDYSRENYTWKINRGEAVQISLFSNK